MRDYKEVLTTANTRLSGNPLTRFVGYGLKHGRAYGTLRGVPDSQIIDTPIAENLMMGLAIGLSLKGYRPVVFFERMDFILNALDAIVNHLDKIHYLSHGEFSPACIIRAVIGNKNKPLYTGLPHTQDFTLALRQMVSFPIVRTHVGTIETDYAQAERDLTKGVSTILVEFKDQL